MKKYINLYIISLLIYLILILQTSFAQSARARGMGGAFLAVSDDETAAFYNPAGLSQIQGREASIQSKVNERDMYQWDSIAFTGHIYEDQPKETFSISDYLEHNILEEPIPRRPKYSYGFAYVHDYRSPTFGSLVGGEFSGVKREVDQVLLAFGTRFPIARKMLAREQLYGGLKLHFLNIDRKIPTLGTHSKREAQSLGIGLLYHYNDRITGGLTVDNVVQRLRGTQQIRDDVTLNLGGALRLSKNVLVAADITNVAQSPKAPERQWRVGVEKKFIENDFTLRMGSWNGTLTLGFGLNLIPNIRFDYSFYNGEIVKEHHIGAHVVFD